MQLNPRACRKRPAFTGLHNDVDAGRKDNEAKQGDEVIRKSGLIINSGGAQPRRKLPLPFSRTAVPGITDKATMEQLRRENEKKCGCWQNMLAQSSALTQRLARYGLSKEYVDSIVLPSPVKTAQTATLERQVQAGGHRAKGKPTKATVKLSLMTASLDALSDSQRRALLRALHRRLHSLLAAGPAATAAPVRAPRLQETATADCGPTTGANRCRCQAWPRSRQTKGRGCWRRSLKARATRCASIAKSADNCPPAMLDARRKRTKAGGGAGGTGIEHLVGMGFDAQKAADALAECDGDLSAAVAWLFQHCAA